MMSDVTGFSRARRVEAAKKAADNSQKEESICLECMTVPTLKALCDERDIEYKAKATKSDLIKLLEG